MLLGVNIMADEKWSNFPAAGSVSDSDYSALVQGGTKQTRRLQRYQGLHARPRSIRFIAPLTRTLSIGGSAKNVGSRSCMDDKRHS